MATNDVLIFHTEEDFLSYLTEFEIKNHTKFVRQWKRTRIDHNVLESLEGCKIRFQDVGHPSQGQLKIISDGTPFVIVGNDIYECHQGPQHHVLSKSEDKESDHTYVNKKRQFIQCTKKQDCPAKVRVRKIIKFPDYKVDGTHTSWKRKVASKKLKDDFNVSTNQQYVLLAIFPKEEDHMDHLMGESSDYTQPLDKRITAKIKELAAEGHRNVSSIKLMLEQYSKEIVPDVQKNNRRFYPTKEDIRSHVYHSVLGSNLVTADGDQNELKRKLHEWQNDFPNNSYFFRPTSCTDDEINSLLLVIQTEFQKKLLIKYGHQMTLMDGTYKTTKYDVPMYNLCVHTNVGFYIVASFFISIDSKAAIIEGLMKIKEWNPTWKPTAFISDYDLREIGALEATFKGSTVFLCDFHREQAWQRWIAKNEVGNKEEILEQLRNIASADSETELMKLQEQLRGCNAYKHNEKFRNWLEKKWLSECKRWAFCYRKGMSHFVTTTNGIERQHRVVKEQFLKEFGIGKSLSNVCSVLVENYFPDSELRYKRENLKFSGENRKYSMEVPEFLKNRPTNFVRHCLQRLPPEVTEITKDEVTQSHEGTYILNCKASSNIYYVETKESTPKCSCKDFVKSNWPCKHILAVYKLFDYPEIFTKYFSSPLFVLDQDFDIISENNPTISIDEVHHDDVEMKEINETSERNGCLETLNQLEGIIYSLNSVKVLSDTKMKLDEILNSVQTYHIKNDSIPLSKRKKWRRTSNRRVYKKRKATGAKEMKTQCPLNDVVSDEYEMENMNKHSDNLSNLWNAPGSDTPLVQVGPFIISSNSFQYIKTTLSDDVIDASLRLILKERNVLHINCITLTAIFNGDTDVHHNVPGENFFSYDACAGAICENDSHWSLIIINPAEKLLTYLNPLGETPTTCRTLLKYWHKFLKDRFKMGIEPRKPGSWKIRTLPHSKQPDSISCGVYTIKFAENFFNEKPLSFTWSRKDIYEERRRIALRILAASSVVLPSKETMDVSDIYIKTAEKQELKVVTDDEVNKSQSETENDDVDKTVNPETATDDVDDTVNLETSNDDDEDNTVGSKPLPNVDDNIESEYMTTINRGEKRKRQASLRYKPKKRRSSFIYSPVRHVKRTSEIVYCLCKKKYNKSDTMWCCDVCKEWYHPRCIDRDDKETPPRKETAFKCSPCLNEELKEWPVESLSDVFNMDLSDMQEGESYINADDVRKHMKKAYERCWYLVRVEGNKSVVPWMRRHFNFIKFKGSANLQGFGEALFSQEAIFMIKENLKRQFQEKKKRHAIYSLHYVIPSVANDDLKRLLEENSVQTENYTMTVLLKEAMVAIMQEVTGDTYEKVDNELKKTEARSLSKVRSLIFKYSATTRSVYQQKKEM